MYVVSMTYKHEGTKVHVPTLYPRAPLSLATVWGWNIARTLDVVLLKKMREVGVEEARYQNNLKPNTICGGRGGVLHPWSNSNIPPSLAKNPSSRAGLGSVRVGNGLVEGMETRF